MPAVPLRFFRAYSESLRVYMDDSIMSGPREDSPILVAIVVAPRSVLPFLSSWSAKVVDASLGEMTLTRGEAARE